MKITPVFRATRENDTLRFYNKETVQNYIKNLPSNDIDVVIKTHKNQRSSNQNSYYWGVVVGLIADHTGNSIDDIHEYLKSLFLKDYISISGDEKEIIRSTSSLKTDEMEDYLSQVRQWASLELSVYIPLPNEVVHG